MFDIFQIGIAEHAVNIIQNVPNKYLKLRKQRSDTHMENVFLFSVFFAFSFNDIYVLIFDNHQILHG